MARPVALDDRSAAAPPYPQTPEGLSSLLILNSAYTFFLVGLTSSRDALGFRMTGVNGTFGKFSGTLSLSSLILLNAFRLTAGMFFGHHNLSVSDFPASESAAVGWAADHAAVPASVKGRAALGPGVRADPVWGQSP